jgi:cyclic pyranopterin monophosphate synthase
MSGDFSHLDEEGRARMVDVGSKAPTARIARAEAFVSLSESLRNALRNRTLPKGDPFEVVRIAGIQAAKKTSDLIPLCHPLSLDRVDVRVEMTDTGVRIETVASNSGRTGVEMEALVAAAVAALALYDMCKGVDKGVEIGPVRLLEKSGGKSGSWKRA